MSEGKTEPPITSSWKIKYYLEQNTAAVHVDVKYLLSSMIMCDMTGYVSFKQIEPAKIGKHMCARYSR